MKLPIIYNGNDTHGWNTDAILPLGSDYSFCDGKMKQLHLQIIHHQQSILKQNHLLGNMHLQLKGATVTPQKGKQNVSLYFGEQQE